MITFLKGIIVGLGAVAPGLSGSILLVLFGLYSRVVDTVSHIFKDIKKNILFLLPLFLGIGLGAVLFSKLVDFLLESFPMQTNYTFLGLIIGTIPMLLSEVRKEGFKKRHYAFMGGAFAVGVVFFILTVGMFPDITEPNIFNSLTLGLAVAAAYLVPGVDSAATLSVFGLYKLWNHSLGELDFKVLIPAGVGLVIGGVIISIIFNRLFKKWYTTTYSVIFGLFISVVLNFMFKECPLPGLNIETLVSVILFVAGLASLLSSDE